MRKSLLKLLGVVAGLMLSTCVFALGMGGINVASGLGQTLKADIELVSVSKAEKTSLVARLASPDIYKGAGLEYPYGNKLTFKIEHRASGDAYIQVSSAQPINDPFVSLLVELTWSSGKLLREYTFLLDPPGYVAEQPEQAEVQTVAPSVQAVPQSSEAMPVQRAATEIEEFLGEKPATPARAPTRARPTTVESTATNVASGEITVKRGDTLNKIAAQNKPADVSLERMLVALYRANADQFDGKNMNRIKTGKILRLPDQDELLAVSQHDATNEIHAQVADWNVYRQKLAGAAALSSQPQVAQQVATGKITSSVADKAPIAKESAKEVLKLSKGEAPGDKAGAAGKPMSAQDKKNAAQEDAIAKAKAVAEEKAHAALLEKNLKDMQRLAQLKSEAAALAQPSVVVAASSVAAASQVTPAPVVKPKPKPKVVVPEPSLLDQIMAEPVYLAGGVAAVLGLGGLGFMMYRRRKSAPGVAPLMEDDGATTGKITAPVMPSPETGDFTSAVAGKPDVAQQSDDVDPISEADLFLNFGRDAQAEEILKEALQNTPNNHQIHLKLLGIYANRKDVNSFSAIARQLQDSADDEAWQQAAAMGRKLEPNNPMYGGEGTIEDADSATMRTVALNVSDIAPDADAAAQQVVSTPDVDFDLGASDEPNAATPEQDFLSDVEKTTTMLPEDKGAAQAGMMDFDVTSTNPGLPASSGMDFDITETGPTPVAAVSTEPMSPNLDDLVFDITATHAPAPEIGKPEQAAPVEDSGMAFTLDFPTEKPASAESAADIGLSEISLNLDDAVATSEKSVETKDEHWHEVATKFDLAKAYQEMGDATGAREILEEVLREGDEEQQAAAQALIDKLN